MMMLFPGIANRPAVPARNGIRPAMPTRMARRATAITTVASEPVSAWVQFLLAPYPPFHGRRTGEQSGFHARPDRSGCPAVARRYETGVFALCRQTTASGHLARAVWPYNAGLPVK